jgi:single-strand DNA-binding protein
MNKVILLGRLGADPDVKHISDTQMVANFNVATTHSNKQKDGSYKDYTEWSSCFIFGKSAKYLQDYGTKGSQILVEGKLTTESWEDKKTGETRYKTKILCNKVQLFKNTTGSQSTEKQKHPDYKPANKSEFTNDEIPF